MEKQEQEERKHIEALDRKIERLQEKVIKKHKEYSVLAEELSTLLDAGVLCVRGGASAGAAAPAAAV